MSKLVDLGSSQTASENKQEPSGTESAPENINLCLSLGLGGLYGEDSSKEILKRSSSLPVRSNWPENWAVESASRNAAFCRAMDKLKSNAQDPRQIPEGEAKAKVRKNDANLIVKSMPSVTTTGDGPKGKRIDGFLYKYKQGLDIEIMCICHGQVMSPLEFFKHAGGTEIDNPMKYINVLPTTH